MCNSRKVKAIIASADALEAQGEAAIDRGEFDPGVADIAEAVRINPDDRRLRARLARLYYIAGKFDGAVEHLNKVYPTGYNIVIRYLASNQTGRDGSPQLLEEIGTQPEGWPKTLVELFLNRVTPQEVLEKAVAGQVCEAHFFIGHWQRIRGDKTAGTASLNRAKETCRPESAFAALAAADLRRFEK